MSSGIGRGRGWLKLANNAEAPKPIGLSNLPDDFLINNRTSPPLQSSSEFEKLVTKIKEFKLGGEQKLSKKEKQLKELNEFWSDLFKTPEEVMQSFVDVYNKCLCDREFGKKMIGINFYVRYSSPLLVFHGCSFSKYFLQKMQDDFTNREQIYATNRSLFRNFASLLGDYFNIFSLSYDERKPVFLSNPILTCLEMLLNNKLLSDLTSFTTILCSLGMRLKVQLPEELAQMMVSVRNVLVTENLGKEEKLWLLLALEVYNNKFGMLSPEVYKFYEDNVGSASMPPLQRPQDPLSIETMYISKILDSFQSNVNVLQISSSPTETTYNTPLMEPRLEPTEATISPQQNISLTKKISSTKKENTGRPILGAGARADKNKPKEENGKWNSKKNNEFERVLRNEKETKGVGATWDSSNRFVERKTTKMDKGWEHDDRFDNDYDYS